MWSPLIIYDVMDYAVEITAAALEMDAPKIRYLYLLIAGIVVAFPFQFMPLRFPLIKCVYCIAWSLFLGFYLFGYNLLHLVVSPLLVYALVKFWPSKRLTTIVIFGTMAHLSFNHISRMIANYGNWDLDHSAAMMVLTIKLSTFAFNVSDGRNKGKDDEAAARVPAEVTEYKKRLALAEVPDFLHFLGWIYFPSTFFVGPAFEFKTFQRYLDPNYTKRPPLLLCMKRCAINFCWGMVWLGILMMEKQFNLNFAMTDEAQAWGFAKRWGYVFIATSITRAPYYFAWKLSEAGSVAAGLGFEGIDKNGKEDWDYVCNAYSFKVEFMTNLKGLADWNRATARWLRYYVYFRVPKSVFRYKTLIAFLVSAFWHGFYPGYYLAFIGLAITTELGRIGRRAVRPLMVDENDKSPLWYDIFTWALTFWFLNPLAVNFKCLSLEHSWFLIKTTTWPTYATFLLFFALIPFKGMLRKGKKE